MAEASLKLGGSWATKEGSLLGFNDQNGNYKPIPFDFTRATTATRVNRNGLIEEVQSGVPRIDFTGDGSLLLEPQRTNNFTYSEYFDDWLSNRLDRTANNLDSPEGIQNAYKVAQQSGFTTAPNINKGGIAAGTYTISIFAKKGSWNYLAISFQGVSYFNLETGSKGTINANHTAIIEDYGNGWYRCSITRTTTTTQTPAFYFAESDNTLTTSDTQGYMYIYGAQLEAGSYATSYIKTSGSAVTRLSDIPNSTFASSIDSLVGFTILGEFKTNGGSGTSSPFLEFQQATGEYLGFGSNGATWRGRIRNGATNELHTSSASIFSKAKLAIACDGNGFSMYANGTQFANGTTDFSGLTSITELFKRDTEEFGSLRNYQIAIYASRLTDTELQELTTL